ncbi:optineurin-like [Ornithodoros turicata]|uniref:optineurin-like n=1 Tax=Ornithodoros turicata TaxID=34597 RepID=UPI00313A4CC1
MDVEQLHTSRIMTPDEDEFASGFVMLPHQDESITVDASADAIEKLRLSFNSGGSDGPVEEAERYVKDLMKENTNLRESLEKHMAMLQCQCDTVTTWQKQFTDANAVLQKALEESRANEEAMRKECNLKAASQADHHEVVEKLKQEMIAKEAQIGGLQDKEKVLENTVEELTDKVSSLEEALQDMEAKNKALNERYKETIERMDLLEVHANHTPSAGMLTLEPISTFSSVSDIVSCTAKDVSGPKLAEVIVQLHNEQSKTAQQAHAISSLTAEVAKLTAQLKESEQKVASLEALEHQVNVQSSSEIANQARRISKFEESIMQRDLQLHNQQLQNDNLQRRLEEKTSEVDCLRRALLEAEQRQVNSQQNYDELLKTWQEYETSGERAYVTVEHGRPNAQQQQKQLNDKIQELQTQASIMNKALDEKNQQLTEVQRMNEEFKRQLELLPPLQAQLEVYSTDYTTEKEQRVSAQAQVAELQGRVQELMNENTNLVSRLSDGQSVRSGSVMHSISETTSMGNGLLCPLCTRSCATQRAYIDHVQACVEATEPSGP